MALITEFVAGHRRASEAMSAQLFPDLDAIGAVPELEIRRPGAKAPLRRLR
jgi:hypothetical protein